MALFAGYWERSRGGCREASGGTVQHAPVQLAAGAAGAKR